MKKEYSRTQNTVFNLNANLITMMVTQILGFISRTIFIKILDVSYLGINGLYSNLLSMLSLAELGVGTAIVYSLYKPLANKDHKRISALMALYRKSYMIIGTTILVTGFILLFFLEELVADVSSIEHYRLYYILFLLNTVSTYFLAYKETLINTDQRGYLLTKKNLLFQILTTASQLTILIITRNYAAYLFIQIFVQTIRKIFINSYITKLYPEIDFKSKEKISQQEKRTIIKNVCAMFFQKIGGYIVFGTDNILIARFVDLVTVGKYSNYTMITNIVFSFVNIPFSSIGASIGNLSATDKINEYKVYRLMYFVNYIYSSFTSICLFVFFNPFMEIWIGEEYTFVSSIVFVIVLNYYMTTMRKSTELFYNSNGLFWYSRYKSIIEALINLVVSVVLACKLGILGVLIGTTVSSILTSVLYDVYILFKFGFNKSTSEYLKSYVFKYIIYIVLTLCIGILLNIIVQSINPTNLFMLFISGIICLLVFVFINFILFHKSEEYQIMIKKIVEVFSAYKH